MTMNKKFGKWTLAGALMLSAFPGMAQQINPMTEAVLQNYAEILAENPKDYLTLYDRASQYYSLGDYVRALSDIDMALEYTPEKDTDYRVAEYSLKGDILIAQKNYQGALDAINSALALNSVSLPDLYKAGNLYIMLDRPSDALKAFQAIQRETPRSQEAFYGMAKANLMLGNRDEAEKLIKEVENLGKQSYVTYCRIGDLYADMGNIKDATTNYVIAYSLEDKSPRPIESLKNLYRKDYRTVTETIDGIIATNNDKITLNYIKAILAYSDGKYKDALNACRNLASDLEEDTPAVYRMIAMSHLALNDIDNAVKNIEVAEKLVPGNSGVLLDKAEILLSKNPQESLNAAKQGLVADPENENLQLMAAKSAILTGAGQEALGYLNQIILSNPVNIEALLLRGYVNTETLNDGKAGVADYTRAGNVQQDGEIANLVLAALAKSKINKKLDADGLINQAVSQAGNEKDALYLIAVYYAQTGNLEKAKEYADKALLNGYENLYNLQRNNEPLINLVPIHHLLGGK